MEEKEKNTEKKKKRKHDSKSLQEKKEELLKELNQKILKSKQTEREKAKKEITQNLNFAISGLKLNELKDYGKSYLIYGILEMYKNLSKEEKHSIEERSRELYEQFSETRKKPFINKKNKTEKEN